MSDIVESTLGRFIFNEVLPQDLGFVDRSVPENALKLEVDFHVSKKGLKQILEKVINCLLYTSTGKPCRRLERRNGAAAADRRCVFLYISGG